ncbi:hypothetical protein ACH429_13495 [Streptomyces pathocidini]|uniref:Uncharacterized protein n=1 Tax=Streptomyces pathocidini TaxID=1650571 RepID=A0ABW7UR63_9ACTN|nr:hypothetical protein [Streptomyces pathocidini]
MPDDVGGRPFPDGEEPDSHSHGAADEESASVVFDEDFIRAARVHEPTAAERMLAAAQARAEAEARQGAPYTGRSEEDFHDEGLDPDDPDADYDPADTDAFEHDPEYEDCGPYGRYGGVHGPYRGHARWHRPVAWVLAVLMGVGVVALAFAAVYRGTAGSRQEPAPPPATSGVDGPQVGRLIRQPEGPPGAQAESAAPSAPVGPGSH